MKKAKFSVNVIYLLGIILKNFKRIYVINIVGIYVNLKINKKKNLKMLKNE